MDRREYNRRSVAAFRRQNQGKEPPEHGKSGYDNYGCRCSVCTEGKRRR